MIRILNMEHGFRHWTTPVIWLAVGLACVASQPLLADDATDEKANAHILQAEMALQRNEYKVASEEYREAAEHSKDVEIARQATQVSYTYGFNEDALRSA
jgi:hypothetical protein